MREMLLWQQIQVLEVDRALDSMYIKLSGTLIIHKTLSKFAPYEFKLRFKPSIFVRKPSIFNPPALENLFFKIILMVKI